MALLRAHPNLTALFATNDLMAIGALQAAADLGRRVPDDLSVVGMTDIQLAHQFRPALTTVRFPTPLIAAHAISMALKMIEGEPPSESTRVCGTPELAVRESTAVGPQGGIGATRELKRLRRVRSDSSVHRAVARAMGAQVAATAATTCQRSIQAAMPEAQRTEARKSPSGDAFPGSPDSTRDHALLTGGLRRSRTGTVPLSRVSGRFFNIRHHISKASFSPLPPCSAPILFSPRHALKYFKLHLYVGYTRRLRNPFHRVVTYAKFACSAYHHGDI